MNHCEEEWVKPTTDGRVNYLEGVKIENKVSFMPWDHWQRRVVQGKANEK